MYAQLVLAAAAVAVVVEYVGTAIAQLLVVIVETKVAIVIVAIVKLAKVAKHVQVKVVIPANQLLAVLAVTGEAGVHGLM
jgi:hypothetical protein